MSIRFKIIIGLITIILFTYVILAFSTVAYVNKIFVNEVQNRVNFNLNSAKYIYNDNIERIDRTLKHIPIHRNYNNNFNNEISNDLQNAFSNNFIRSRLDILIFTDTNGRVIYRANNPLIYGDTMSYITLIKKTIDKWAPEKGTIIIDRENLQKEGNELSAKSDIKIISTQNSVNKLKINENRGFFIAYTHPVTSNDGNTKLGILFGAYLVNNKTEITENIKAIIFQNQKYKNTDLGAVSIFFDDIRISTTIKNQDSSKSIGTRLSQQVYDSVIIKGKRWSDRAFVVNDWYLTAYEPIIDPEGNIIGSLGIGLLEEPFRQPQKTIILFFFIALSISAIATLVLLSIYTKMIIKPIEQIIKVSEKIISGDLSARCKIYTSGELGTLCRTINQMADSLEQQVNKMQEETRMQIMQSEKLASIGRLAAGVAHEINNPLTGVLTFAHFLKDKKNNNEEDIHDINIIIQETTRVRDIIRGLLDFARQSQPNKTMININIILTQLLILIRGQKEFKNIDIIENLSDNLPEFLGDKNQLQQVFLNLILNAGEAISGEGKITITTTSNNNSIFIILSDTGCGISEEDIYKIFDPFFTTKPVGKGTGLGLSVSYGIIQQHGGKISCKSIQGEGTTFTVSFPY